MPKHNTKSVRVRKTKKHTLKNRGNNKHLVVGLIYASWCGHCQSLKPEWETMKKNMGEKKVLSNSQIIEIEDSDPSKNEKINKINKALKGGATKLEANGYPTIFKKMGKVLEYYDGERSAAAIENWITQKITKIVPKPDDTKIKTWQELITGGFQSGTLSKK